MVGVAKCFEGWWGRTLVKNPSGAGGQWEVTGLFNFLMYACS